MMRIPRVVEYVIHVFHTYTIHTFPYSANASKDDVAHPICQCQTNTAVPELDLAIWGVHPRDGIWIWRTSRK